MRSLVRIRLVFEELHLEASGITHPIPATGRQRGIWGVLSSFSTKGSNCVNKRWSRNVQCRVTWDNGACRSLKTQVKHMCAYINTDRNARLCMNARKWHPVHRPTPTRTSEALFLIQPELFNQYRAQTSLCSALLRWKDPTFCLPATMLLST